MQAATSRQPPAAMQVRLAVAAQVEQLEAAAAQVVLVVADADNSLALSLHKTGFASALFKQSLTLHSARTLFLLYIRTLNFIGPGLFFVRKAALFFCFRPLSKLWCSQTLQISP